MNERAKRIATSISEMLDAIEKHDVERTKPLRVKAYNLEEFSRLYKEGEFFLQDPIGESLRRGVRKAGKLLAASFGTEVMLEVAELAAGSNGRWANIIDKQWDGLTTVGGDTWLA